METSRHSVDQEFIDIVWSATISKCATSEYICLSDIEVLINEISVFLRTRGLLTPDEKRIQRQLATSKARVRMFRREVLPFLLRLSHCSTLRELVETRSTMTFSEFRRLVALQPKPRKPEHDIRVKSEPQHITPDASSPRGPEFNRPPPERYGRMYDTYYDSASRNFRHDYDSERKSWPSLLVSSPIQTNEITQSAPKFTASGDYEDSLSLRQRIRSQEDFAARLKRPNAMNKLLPHNWPILRRVERIFRANQGTALAFVVDCLALILAFVLLMNLLQLALYVVFRPQHRNAEIYSDEEVVNSWLQWSPWLEYKVYQILDFLED